LVALSTAFRQAVTRSAGALDPRQLEPARALLASGPLGKPVVFALHHPPLRRAVALLDWLDGLEGHEVMAELFRQHDHTFALHGHTHVARDVPVRAGAPPRIFSTRAVVQSSASLRLYSARF